jgi:tetratricopeptide (TPR) repeat protein
MMTRFARSWFAAAALAAATACSNAPPPETGTREAVTFTHDVAPIVFKNCITCHRPGESAPFSLLTYDDVKRRAALIADVTERRVMPPWLPSPGHGTFAGERRLSDRDIDVLRRWHEQGAPEGDPKHLAPEPAFADGWQLGQPDLVLTLPQPYRLRAEAGDVWRNFVIPVTVPSPRFVKAVEIRPGSARFVHHAVMGLDQSRSSARRDRQDEEPGFAGMELGDAQPPDGHLVGWSPGMAPVPSNTGSAWRIDPGSDLVLQLHLLPTGKIESVQPQVGLYFAEAPPTGPPMVLLRLDADQQLDIPPGARDFAVTDRFRLPVDVDLLAIYPHAHFLARTMDARATLPDGTERPLIRIESWDFKWQDVYRYAQPMRLPKDTTIAFRYTYDNSEDNPRNPTRPPKRVSAGMRSGDEMAHLQLQVRPVRTDDVLTLRTAFYHELVRKAPGDPWVHYELGNLLRDGGRRQDAVREYRAALALDPRHAAALTNLAVVLQEDGLVDAAVPLYRAAISAEPDFVPAQFNLANALRARGDVASAVRHYEEAIRLEPGLAAARNNLGEILASQNRMEDAIVQFREAVRLNPASALAHGNLGAALGATGRLDEAIGELRRALQLDPGNEMARRNLEVALGR